MRIDIYFVYVPHSRLLIRVSAERTGVTISIATTVVVSAETGYLSLLVTKRSQCIYGVFLLCVKSIPYIIGEGEICEVQVTWEAG